MEHILKEIKEFTSNHKKTLLKLLLIICQKNIGGYL